MWAGRCWLDFRNSHEFCRPRVWLRRKRKIMKVRSFIIEHISKTSYALTWDGWTSWMSVNYLHWESNLWILRITRQNNQEKATLSQQDRVYISQSWFIGIIWITANLHVRHMKKEGEDKTGENINDRILITNARLCAALVWKSGTWTNSLHI